MNLQTETSQIKKPPSGPTEIECAVLRDIPPTLIPAQERPARELLRLIRENPNFRFVFPDEPGGENYDPTPWCGYCGAMTPAKCPCGPIAENN